MALVYQEGKSRGYQTVANSALPGPQWKQAFSMGLPQEVGGQAEDGEGHRPFDSCMNTLQDKS